MKVKLPQSVIRGLKRGLELQRQGFAGKGLRDETVKMARIGVRTGQWEDWKIVKASAWFARHVADRRRMKDPSRWDKAPRYSPAYVAWALWGDDGKGAGRKWIDKTAKQLKSKGVKASPGSKRTNQSKGNVRKKRHNPPPGWSFNPISSAEAYSLRSRLGQAHVVKQARGWDWYVFEGDTFRQLDSGTTGSRRDAFAAATFAMERVDPVLTTAIDQEVKRAARIGGKQPVSKDFMDFYKAHARVNPPSSTASEIEDSLNLIEDFLRSAFMLLEEISGGEIYRTENTREGELNANTLFEGYVPMLNAVIEKVMDVEDVVFRISKEFGGSDYKPQLRIVGRARENAHSDDTLGGVLDLAQDPRIGVVTRSFYYLDASRILIHHLFYPLGSNPNYKFFRRVQDEGRKIDLSYFKVILREIGEEVTRLQREYLEKYDAERRSQIRLIKNPPRTQPYKYGVPAKYLAGLPDKVARKRAAEIIRRRKSGAKTSEPLPGDKIARKKPMKGSKWTRMYKQKYGATAGTTKAKVARETGIPKSIIDEVYKRGVGASRSQGHRPGATDSSWALARVHAFVMKVLHKKGPINQDPDLARKVRSRR